MGNKLVIKDGVCTGCKASTEIRGTLKIPKGTTEIGAGAFPHAHAVTALELPRSLRIIGDKALCWCTGLTGALTFPGGVTEIGARAFQGCRNLNRLALRRSLRTIGAAAFQECTGLAGTLTPQARLHYSPFVNRSPCRYCCRCCTWVGTAITLP